MAWYNENRAGLYIIDYSRKEVNMNEDWIKIEKQFNKDDLSLEIIALTEINGIPKYCAIKITQDELRSYISK